MEGRTHVAFVFCIVFCSLMFFYGDAADLRPDQAGVCIIRMRVTTKCYGNNCARQGKTVRRGNKPQVVYKVVNKTICCSGWAYSDKENLCHPVCQPACEGGGQCLAPNKCSCQSPQVPDPQRPNTCVLPPCLTGYGRNQSDSCEPICSKPCLHGECIAPDRCSCYHGYVNPENDTSTCKPNCPSSCVNGKCEIPNVCSCDDGYVLSSEGNTCTPKCIHECTNGDCVAPDVCKCHEGYKLHNQTTCKPHCSIACTNGICVGPEQCSCLEGYVQDVQDPFTCNPSCQRPCVKGTCVAPDICECDSGYEEDDHDNYTCVPICSRTCGLAGRCVEPEKCLCLPGFEVEQSTGKCKPMCSQPCINGQCTSPEVCTCSEGYLLQNNYTCAPSCSTPCVNAECISPNVCKCHEDYESTDVDSSICWPKCDNCTHGTCKEPNDCQCDDGYEKHDNSCIPVCSKSCKNGLCINPEQCQCKDGYLNTNGTCLAICSTSCVNGVCSSPEVCTCQDGYELDEDDKNLCRKLKVNSNRVEIPPEHPISDRYVSEVSWTWMYGAVGLLFMLAIGIAIQRIWRHKQAGNESTSANSTSSDFSASYKNGVMTVAPGSLLIGMDNDNKKYNDEDTY